MASQIFQRGPSTPEMNITPLIDVTFLLIIFFMLVNNIISEEMVEMFVPELTEPRTQALGEVERVVVNIVPAEYARQEREANPLLFQGQAQYVKVGALQQFATEDTEGLVAALRDAQQRNPEVEVLLRADAALYYEEVQPVMMALTQAGITTVKLVAALPGDPPAGGTP